MTKEKLQAILHGLPTGTLIYVRQGDDAWPARPRRFNDEQPVLYLEAVPEDEDGDHLNFPEHYSGCKEIPVSASATKGRRR